MWQVTCWVEFPKYSQLITYRNVDDPRIGQFGCKAIIKIVKIAPDRKPTLDAVTDNGRFSVE